MGRPERSGTPDFEEETPLGESSEKQSKEMASVPKVIPILKAAMRRAPGSRPLRQTAISALGNFNAKNNREEAVSSDDSSDEQDISSDENEDLYQPDKEGGEKSEDDDHVISDEDLDEDFLMTV